MCVCPYGSRDTHSRRDRSIHIYISYILPIADIFPTGLHHPTHLYTPVQCTQRCTPCRIPVIAVAAATDIGFSVHAARNRSSDVVRSSCRRRRRSVLDSCSRSRFQVYADWDQPGLFSVITSIGCGKSISKLIQVRETLCSTFPIRTLYLVWRLTGGYTAGSTRGRRDLLYDVTMHGTSRFDNNRPPANALL